MSWKGIFPFLQVAFGVGIWMAKLIFCFLLSFNECFSIRVPTHLWETVPVYHIVTQTLPNGNDCFHPTLLLLVLTPVSEQ